MQRLIILSLLFFLAMSCGNNAAEATADDAETTEVNANERGVAGADANTAASNESEQDCIDAILREDTALGDTRNHACETASLADAIQQYVDALSALDYEGCPREFSKAFEAHIDAWAAMKTFTEQFADMRGEMHDLFYKLERGEQAEEFKPLLKAIWDTWAPIQTAKDAG